MLPARVAAELRNDDELSERLLPIRFIEESQEVLMEGLVKLVDDHTEYFRGHLEVFAKAERRV